MVSLEHLLVYPRTGEVDSVIKATSKMFEDKGEGEIKMLKISEMKQSRQTERIKFSSILNQNFTQYAELTKLYMAELFLDLTLSSDPSQGVSKIMVPEISIETYERCRDAPTLIGAA